MHMHFTRRKINILTATPTSSSLGHLRSGPPPPILEERIRSIIDDEQERRELRIEAERKRKGLPPFDQPGGGG